MQYRLRYLVHDFELPVGDFVIGRSEDCQLALDDPMVSRKHATLRVTPTEVTVLDLGSRNGVMVNGQRITSNRQLVDRDRIGVGTHEMILSALSPDAPRTRRTATRTLGNVDVRDIVTAEMSAAVRATGPGGASTISPPGVMARITNSLTTLGGLAEKAFALGRIDEAERLLTNVLGDLLRELEAGRSVDPALLERAGSYALKLGAGNKPQWIDWLIDVYHLADRLLPAPVADELAVVARKVKGFQVDPFDDYVEAMRAQSNAFGPNERFVLQRLEGLQRQLTGR